MNTADLHHICLANAVWSLRKQLSVFDRWYSGGDLFAFWPESQ